MSTLFDGFCINYLKTSSCNSLCPLSHEVSDTMNFGVSDYDEVKSICETLKKFLLDAPSPSLNLLKAACNYFVLHNEIEAPKHISKILIKEYAQSHNTYMARAFKTLLCSLQQFYGSQDSAVSVILEYISNICITEDCDPKILDNVVKTIEKSVEVSNKLKVYESVMSVRNYVFPHALVEDIFYFAMRQHQSWIRSNLVSLRMFFALLIRNQHEEYLFHIWKSSPHLIERLKSYMRVQYRDLRIFNKKLNKFKISTSSGGNSSLPLQKPQLSDQQVGKSTVFNINIDEPDLTEENKWPEEDISVSIYNSLNVGGECLKNINAFEPRTVSPEPLPHKLGTFNLHNKDNSTSNRMNVMPHPDDMFSEIVNENSVERVNMHCNENSMFIPKKYNTIIPLSPSDNQSHSPPECNSENSSRISSHLLLCSDFEKDAIAAQQFLNVGDCYSILKLLEKWEDSQYTSELTNHIFCVLANKHNAEMCCNILEGLLSLAIKFGILALDLKRCISSIALNLLLHIGSQNNWTHAYGIFELIMKYELPYYASEVYQQEEFSCAKRVLVCVEVCMVNEDFERAVSLLINYNMLAVDSDQWSLQSKEVDMIMRNKLIITLMDKMINADLSLAKKLLMHLIRQQKNVEKPMKLINSYELLLKKLLDLSDDSAALELFKEASSYQGVPVVYDTVLCRSLVILCVDKNEMQLARMLVKKGYLIGSYPKNDSIYTAMINSNCSQQEMKILIQETLNGIEKQLDSLTHVVINCDLHFVVVDPAFAERNRLSKFMLKVNPNICDAMNRLVYVLHCEFHPCLYVNKCDENSLQNVVVVQSSALTKYFSQHMQNASCVDSTKPDKSKDCESLKKKSNVSEALDCRKRTKKRKAKQTKSTKVSETLETSNDHLVLKERVAIPKQTFTHGRSVI